MKFKVLVVGPGEKTRGGITSVIKMYRNSGIWNKWNCFWIETYIDRNAFYKIFFFVKSYLLFLSKVNSCSIVHIHLSEPTSRYRKSFYFYTAKFFNKKTIIHFHSFSAETTLFGKSKTKYEKMFRKCDTVVALSGYWKSEIKSLCPSAKIEIIHNPAKSNNIKIPVINREKIILFAGTLNKRKGVHDLIQAFLNVSEKHPGWKLFLAGNGDPEEIKKWIGVDNLPGSIVFLGWIDGVEKERLFEKASIFCLPSYAEGFPMAVVEACSYAIPVITTPVGGINDLFRDGENCLITEAGCATGLEEKLEILINNDILRNKIGEAGFITARNNYSIENTANQLNDVYQKVLNS